MAVIYSAERGQSERLLSAGGNLYSLASGQTKTGYATRGRGFWTGKKYDDEYNPKVDKHEWPYWAQEQQVLLDPDEDDEFDDDEDPMLAMRPSGRLDHVTRAQLKEARAMVEAAMGKAVLTIGSLHVDMLLQNPEELTEEQLVKSAAYVNAMIERASNDRERQLLATYAGHLASAIKSTLLARHEVAKAILTKPSEEREKPVDEAKRPPEKAQTTVVNDKGKVAYKYPKQGDGKGPNSDGWRGAPDAEAQQAKEDEEERGQQPPEPEGSDITPPQPIDPSKFAELLGVGPGQLQRFAAKKTKKNFVQFFMRQDLAEKHKLGEAFLGRLYDSLVAPPQKQTSPEQGATQQAGGRETVAGVVGPQPTQKSLIVFNGGKLTGKMRGILKLLKTRDAETVDDIRKCMQEKFKCSKRTSQRITRTLLRKWEEQGAVSIYRGE